VRVRESDRLAPTAAASATMMEVVLPWFNLVNAACSVGLMEALATRTAAHAAATRPRPSRPGARRPADDPRLLARMRIDADSRARSSASTLVALETGRADAMLRVSR